MLHEPVKAMRMRIDLCPRMEVGIVINGAPLAVLPVALRSVTPGGRLLNTRLMLPETVEADLFEMRIAPLNRPADFVPWTVRPVMLI